MKEADPEYEEKMKRLDELQERTQKKYEELQEKLKKVSAAASETVAPIKETIDNMTASEEKEVKAKPRAKQPRVKQEFKESFFEKQSQKISEKFVSTAVGSVISREYNYAAEYMHKFTGAPRYRRRGAEDLEELREKLERSGGILLGKKSAPVPKVPGFEEKDTTEMTEEEIKAYEAEMEKVMAELDAINSTPLVAIEDPDQTVWDKRLEALTDKIKSSSPFLKARKKVREVQNSDNVVISKARDLKYDIEDTIEDTRDAYETSQHPLVWKARDVSDSMFGETETGWALGELQKIDAGFDTNLFLEDMEEYMIPAVTEAFLAGNWSVMDAVCEGQASAYMLASRKGREVTKQYWDTQILDTRNVDIIEVTVIDDIPQIKLMYYMQHVHCIRNEKNEIVEGSESKTKNVLYIWTVRRDFENEQFDYKIMEFYNQTVEQLMG
eukprot:CAMPEP_0175148708 /NCGR_PEP_ID=MMETSP0087-20121206/16791_1 /TAXON_ID=136419 /ORGANISM="Unknown Unknown, Strain D1" /LENGTH=439 /DNA_ID=CAMNT_0016434225 /DNA_START=174 /DNA_END=1493 /DNA_ORIENTATION=-